MTLLSGLFQVNFAFLRKKESQNKEYQESVINKNVKKRLLNKIFPRMANELSE